MLDLTNPEAVRFTKDVLIKQNMLELGVSGWMADFGEYLPVDCVLHHGDPKELHNLWPVIWAKLNREAVEEYGRDDVMFFMRSGYVGVQSYAPMIHCDIGGFFSFMKMKRKPELFIRWMEMCAFSLLMRSHESIRPWANAQFDAEEVTPYTVKLTGVHAALKPYIKHCEELARSGLPAMRPDFYDAMDYGCPVIERHAKTRKVYLPKGEWVGFWTGKPYAGETEYTVPAPLGQGPVFYRKNSAYADLFRRAAQENK